jgi:predicted CopG family antitoxin
MATKTLTITEDAYESLKRMKLENESFSRTILRIAGRKSIRDFVGILSPESATELRDIIARNRTRHREAHHQRMKKIRGVFDRDRS